MKSITLTLLMMASIAFGNFIQLGSDIDGEARDDLSGWSVALSSDGSIVAIGAPWNDENGSKSGHVRLYELNGSSWNQLGSDIDGEAPYDYFGESLALSSDGSVVAIGATGGSLKGHVRLYKWDGSSWNQLGGDIDGEDVLSSGESVALSSDGSIVAIGAGGNDGNGWGGGQVRLYQWDGSSWNQLGSDIDGEAAYDHSGRSVALSSDGSIVAIGSRYNEGNGRNSGHVRLYQWDGSSWSQLGSDIDGEYYSYSGESVALSSDGSIVAIGAPFSPGHVRLYKWDGSSWNQLGGDIDGEASGDRSGSSVALSSDGSIVAIGAFFNDGNGTESGHVRLYQWDGTSWNQLGSDIDGEAAWDNSGWSVALSSDGSIVAVGARSNNGNGSNSGHVRVFGIDSDDDGLSDVYEVNTSSTNPNDSDSDDDGLSDGDEVNTYSTDPNDSDSDDDGLNDDDEVNTYNTNPNLDDDKDLDGLSDSEEVNMYSTNPNRADSDGDGFSDGNEILKGLDPNIFDLIPISNIGIFYECLAGESVTLYATPVNGYPTNFTYQWIYNGFVIPSLFGGTSSNYTIAGSADYNGNWSVLVSNKAGITTNNFIFEVFTDNDQDGLSNGREIYVTTTDPDSADSDDDGLSDYYEVNTSSTDPNNADSDGDGLSDGDEVNIYTTDPTLDDDKDLDGLLDVEEIITYSTDPNNSDTDGDGLSDGYEVNTSSTDPNNSDSDGDGLSDEVEVNTSSTDPNNSDTDGDGLSDGNEYSLLSDEFVIITSTYWSDAQEYAQSNNLQLAVLKTTSDVNRAREYLSSLDPSITSGNNYIWIGGYKKEGQWYWVDGFPIDRDNLPLSDHISNYQSFLIINLSVSHFSTDNDQQRAALLQTKNSTDPINPDSDGDGLNDGDEVNTYATDPNGSDSDTDGLTDGDEINTYGTDPINPDSDGDGLNDGDEVNTYATNPNLDDDKDLDGLSDAEEVNIYSSNPNNIDTDGDGFDDAFEANIASDVFSLTSVDNAIIEYIKARPDLFNLSSGGMTMSEAQAAMRDLRVGSQTFGVSNGNAKIRMYVDESSDLTSTWSNTQHVLELDIPADADTKFYRFRMD